MLGSPARLWSQGPRHGFGQLLAVVGIGQASRLARVREISALQENRRTLESHMVTNAHFMHDVYSAFDSTPPVVAPV